MKGKERMPKNSTTVIISVYNEKELVQNSLALVTKYVRNIIVLDNGSTDGLSEWMSQQPYAYLYFDEGAQTYGKVLNAAVQNFDLNDNIIFMQPRYVLGENCIKEMVYALNQNQKAGIVSSVSNGFPMPQYIEMKELDDLWDVESFAIDNNYQVVGVSSGLWGIKKETLEKVKTFDEDIADLENVVLDYQLRLIQNGYEQMVVPRAVAFDIFSGRKSTDFQHLLNKNDREILKMKWGMNYFNLVPNKRIVDYIDRSKDESFSVLEIGCDLGSTLMEVKRHFPNCSVQGVEISKEAVSIVKYLLEVECGDIEKDEFFSGEKFDFIIFGDVLEHLQDPYGAIRNCRKRMNKNGCILANIPNLMHITIMQQLIHGRFQYSDSGLLDQTHIHLFTYFEIMNMFQREGYVIECVDSFTIDITAEQEELKQNLLKLSDNIEDFMYDTYQFLFRVRLSD